MKKTTTIENLKEGDIFSFINNKSKYKFMAFKWREDILKFCPLGSEMIFETDIHAHALILIHKP